MKDLEERVKQLNEKESEIIKEKHSINERIIEFKKWREKLESLESDIENRRNFLNNQEKALLGELTGVKKDVVDRGTDDDLTQSYDLFDKISESAVVIQRGIIKKVNDSFSDLIGYNSDEMVDKSLFDFVCSEGFYEIEKYYLNRLKGEDVSFYNTVFLTKSNDKIHVEINAKPTLFGEDKAEIAIIKKIDNK
jgi:PAS domain S-box-containing protein